MLNFEKVEFWSTWVINLIKLRMLYGHSCMISMFLCVWGVYRITTPENFPSVMLEASNYMD